MHTPQTASCSFSFRFLFALFALLPFVGIGCSPAKPGAEAPSRIKVMLLTGQCGKYHNWQLSSVILRRTLQGAANFDVTPVFTPPTGADMSGFAPDFSAYDVIVMDYEGDEWPQATRESFERFVAGGGGLVSFHATDNAFPTWVAFNEMIGVGGWGLKPDGNIGMRNESWGPKVRWRDGAMVLDTSPGNATHPPRHDFQIINRAPDHPVMRGLPSAFMHPDDELYSQLRGPAKNLRVLATAFADPAKFPKATGEHEPMLMAIGYGKGRVFHTTLGHAGPGEVEPLARFNSVAFIETLLRGTEWAATGDVKRAVPDDFPTADTISVRAP